MFNNILSLVIFSPPLLSNFFQLSALKRINNLGIEKEMTISQNIITIIPAALARRGYCINPPTLHWNENNMTIIHGNTFLYLENDYS